CSSKTLRTFARRVDKWKVNEADLLALSKSLVYKRRGLRTGRNDGHAYLLHARRPGYTLAAAGDGASFTAQSVARALPRTLHDGRGCFHDERLSGGRAFVGTTAGTSRRHYARSDPRSSGVYRHLVQRKAVSGLARTVAPGRQNST